MLRFLFAAHYLVVDYVNELHISVSYDLRHLYRQRLIIQFARCSYCSFFSFLALCLFVEFVRVSQTSLRMKQNNLVWKENMNHENGGIAPSLFRSELKIFLKPA